jgi:glycosyltransferase involved in cell wall biosynthesis
MMSNLDWLHELDVEYDASTFDTDPFEPQPDGGHTIFPFWVPRPSNHAANGQEHPSRCGYVELPYTLPQDSTLFLLLREKTPEIWMRKLDWIVEHGGMVLLDSHPDYMCFRGSSAATQYSVLLYREFLSYVKARYAGQYWHVLPREMAQYIRTNSRERDSVADVRTRPLLRKRAAVLLFSHYPADPRPRRAAEALAAEGVNVDVICLRDGDDDQAHQCYGRIDVTRVGLTRKRGRKLGYVGQYSAFILISFLYLAARSLRRRYDLVHVHNMPDALVFSAIVPKLLGAKLILDLHDPMPELMQTIFKLPEDSFSVRVLKRLEKWSTGFADLVITVNLACKRIYASRSCDAGKIQVVINSPDDEVFRSRNGSGPNGNNVNGNGSRPFVILYHGSLVQRNGFDLAVDCLDRVISKIPSVRLAVCGRRTAFFDGVMESAARRGLQQRIDYLGICAHQEVAEAIEHCDLGIIPNHRNIFTEINTPTRIFEYLALGKPVIAPKTRGIQDYFAENDLIFFEVGNTDDLARQVEFAYSHPDEVAETVKRGQAVYASQSWRRQRTAFLNAVGELLQSGKAVVHA